MGRQKRDGLPKRVYKRGQKYWYVKDNRWHALGRTECEMYAALARFLEADLRTGDTMRDVIAAWLKADDGFLKTSPVTQHNWSTMIPRLTAFFGDARPAQLQPFHIKEFMVYDKHQLGKRQGKIGAASVNRHVGILSTILTWAIQRGHLSANPCREVSRNREQARTHLPEPDDYRAARDRASPELAVLMEFAYLSAARRGDLLRLDVTDCTEAGVCYTPHKTSGVDGRLRVVPWTPGVRATIDTALALHRGGPALFMPPMARRWTGANLNAAWQRLKPGFHFHDIRAMAASASTNIHEAQKLLAHTGETTTAIYRRGKIVVTPPERL